MLSALDCLSGLHQGICSGLCLGSLPWNSSSQVPGRLASPCFFGSGGYEGNPGSAFALSLPRGSDKQGEVRSRPLADCKLPRYDHQYRCRQDFSFPCSGREISVCGGGVPYFDGSPCSALAGAFGASGFAGEACSSRASSSALSAVAFEEPLVPRVGSSLAPGSSVPGGGGGSVLVDGEGSPPPGGSIRDTCSGSTPVLGRVSVGVGHTPPQSFCVRGVVGGGEVVVLQPPRDEVNVSGIAVISGVGLRSSGDLDVRQLDGCGSRQQAGWTVSGSLCLLASCLLRWTERLDVHLDVRYLSGQSNVLADLLVLDPQAVFEDTSLTQVEHRSQWEIVMSSSGGQVLPGPHWSASPAMRAVVRHSGT